MCDMYAQVNESFVSNINRIYYWNIDNSEDFLYNGAIPQVRVQKNTTPGMPRWPRLPGYFFKKFRTAQPFPVAPFYKFS